MVEIGNIEVDYMGTLSANPRQNKKLFGITPQEALLKCVTILNSNHNNLFAIKFYRFCSSSIPVHSG